MLAARETRSSLPGQQVLQKEPVLGGEVLATAISGNSHRTPLWLQWWDVGLEGSFPGGSAHVQMCPCLQR